MKTENQNEIEASEVMGDIIYSLINGVFSQAREQIKDGLENGVNLLEELDGQEEQYKRFIVLEICKYLANTPTLEARQNVLNW